jgi:hypothetical protein
MLFEPRQDFRQLQQLPGALAMVLRRALRLLMMDFLMTETARIHVRQYKVELAVRER